MVELSTKTICKDKFHKGTELIIERFLFLYEPDNDVEETTKEGQNFRHLLSACLEEFLKKEMNKQEYTNLMEIEKKAIKRALEKTNGNREMTAKLLGIGIRTVYRKIKEFGWKEN